MGWTKFLARSWRVASYPLSTGIDVHQDGIERRFRRQVHRLLPVIAGHDVSVAAAEHLTAAARRATVIHQQH